MKNLFQGLLLAASLLIAAAFPVKADGIFNPGSSGGGGGTGIVGTFTAGNLLLAGTTTAAQDTTKFGFNGGLTMSGGGIPTYNGCYWSDTDSAVCPTGPENVRMRERVFIGNAVGLTDASATCCGAASIWINSAPSAPAYLMRDPQLVVASDRGVGAISGVTRISDQTASGKSAIGVSGYAWNNSPASGTSLTAWGGYFQCDNQPAIATGTACYGIEVDGFNYGTNQSGDPYGAGFGSFGLWSFAGGSVASNAAYVITGGGSGYNTGINITSAGLVKDGGGNSIAVAMGSGACVCWYTAASTPAGILSSNAAGTIRFGALDAAAPVAQTLQAQSVLAGTSNTSGADFTLAASKGTGTGTSGGILVATGVAGSTGSAQNALINTIGFRVGRTIVGSSTSQIAVNPGGVIPIMEIKNNLGANSANGLGIFSFQNSQTTPAEIFLAQSNSNTLNTNAAVTSGGQLGSIYFSGADGTNITPAGLIQVSAAGTVATNQVPGQMIFQTATTGGTLTTALVITDAQVLQYPTVATGTPAASLCIDASNNIIKKTTTGSCV